MRMIEQKLQQFDVWMAAEFKERRQTKINLNQELQQKKLALESEQKK